LSSSRFVNSFGLKEECVMKIKVIKKSGTVKMSGAECPWVVDVPLEKR